MSKQSMTFDLNKIEIASPCSADWDQMKGDQRIRHCSQCNLNVYNIAEMNSEEAKSLIASTLEGKRVCVRLLRRHDGTLLTKDCPVGVRRLRMLKLKWHAWRIAAVVAIVTCISWALPKQAKYKVVKTLKSMVNSYPTDSTTGVMVGPSPSQPIELTGSVAEPIPKNEKSK